MDFLALAKERASCRGFLATPVSNEQVSLLLQAAAASPSAGNCQPWHFYVVSEKQVIGQIPNEVYRGAWICSASVIIVVCVVEGESGRRYGSRGESLYCLQDTAAAVQNILLCAQSLGLASCWVGAFSEEACKTLLGMPKNHRPVALLPIGYAQTKPVKPARKAMGETVTFVGGTGGALPEESAQPPKFTSCDLSGAHFSNVNLAGSRFENISMAGMEITDANLTGARITESNLSGLTIENCRLENITVNGQKLTLA